MPNQIVDKICGEGNWIESIKLHVRICAFVVCRVYEIKAATWMGKNQTKPILVLIDPTTTRVRNAG